MVMISTVKERTHHRVVRGAGWKKRPLAGNGRGTRPFHWWILCWEPGSCRPVPPSPPAACPAACTFLCRLSWVQPRRKKNIFRVSKLIVKVYVNQGAGTLTWCCGTGRRRGRRTWASAKGSTRWTLAWGWHLSAGHQGSPDSFLSSWPADRGEELFTIFRQSQFQAWGKSDLNVTKINRNVQTVFEIWIKHNEDQF